MLTLLSLCTTYHEAIMWAGPIIAIAWALIAMLALQEWAQYRVAVVGSHGMCPGGERIVAYRGHEEWVGDVWCQSVVMRRYQRI